MINEFINYYAVLGVPYTITSDELKSAYRKLAKSLHPDLHPGDRESAKKFAEVNKAYEVLSDKDARLKFDDALYALEFAADPAKADKNFGITEKLKQKAYKTSTAAQKAAAAEILLKSKTGPSVREKIKAMREAQKKRNRFIALIALVVLSAVAVGLSAGFGGRAVYDYTHRYVTVTFDYDFDGKTATEKILRGEVLGKAENYKTPKTERAGMYIEGWYEGREGSGREMREQKIGLNKKEQTLTVYANWASVASARVKFNYTEKLTGTAGQKARIIPSLKKNEPSSGVIVNDVQTVRLGDKTWHKPSINFHTFDKWVREDGTEFLGIGPLEDGKNIDVFAVFSINSYSVILNPTDKVRDDWKYNAGGNKIQSLKYPFMPVGTGDNIPVGAAMEAALKTDYSALSFGGWFNDGGAAAVKLISKAESGLSIDVQWFDPDIIFALFAGKSNLSEATVTARFS